MMENYIIVSAKSVFELQNKVMNFILYNYVPIGGITIESNSPRDRIYHQPMVRQ